MGATGISGVMISTLIVFLAEYLEILRIKTINLEEVIQIRTIKLFFIDFTGTASFRAFA